MRWRPLCVQLGHNIALYTLLSIYQAYKSFCRNNKSFKVEKREKEHWSSKHSFFQSEIQIWGCLCPFRQTLTTEPTGRMQTSPSSVRPALVTILTSGWPRRSMVSGGLLLFQKIQMMVKSNLTVYLWRLWTVIKCVFSGKECKICTRPFTIFRWCPGAKMRFKKTEVISILLAILEMLFTDPGVPGYLHGSIWIMNLKSLLKVCPS